MQNAELYDDTDENVPCLLKVAIVKLRPAKERKNDLFQYDKNEKIKVAN